MARKKGKRVPVKAPKTELVSTTFFTRPASEESLSMDCKNVLTKISTSKAYPNLNKVATDGMATWQLFNDLLLKSKTLENSPQITDDKTMARYNLTMLMWRIVWSVQLDGNNDILKMTGDTGLTPQSERSKAGPIEVAPSKVVLRFAVPDNPTLDTYKLPLLFKTTSSTPAGVNGSAYRLKMDGKTWTEAENFKDNQNRYIPGLKLGDKGVLQARWNGGSNGTGPWSAEFPFVVAVASV